MGIWMVSALELSGIRLLGTSIREQVFVQSMFSGFLGPYLGVEVVGQMGDSVHSFELGLLCGAPICSPGFSF